MGVASRTEHSGRRTGCVAGSVAWRVGGQVSDKGGAGGRLTGGHVVVSLVQPASVGVAKVEGDVVGEKVPVVQVVQVRSAVAVAAAE